ncbi:hypothetical protein Tco_0853000 [Tanacetum coccineum]
MTSLRCMESLTGGFKDNDSTLTDSLLKETTEPSEKSHRESLSVVFRSKSSQMSLEPSSHETKVLTTAVNLDRNLVIRQTLEELSAEGLRVPDAIDDALDYQSQISSRVTGQIQGCILRYFGRRKERKMFQKQGVHAPMYAAKNFFEYRCTYLRGERMVYDGEEEQYQKEPTVFTLSGVIRMVWLGTFPMIPPERRDLPGTITVSVEVLRCDYKRVMYVLGKSEGLRGVVLEHYQQGTSIEVSFNTSAIVYLIELVDFEKDDLIIHTGNFLSRDILLKMNYLIKARSLRDPEVNPNRLDQAKMEMGHLILTASATLRSSIMIKKSVSMRVRRSQHHMKVMLLNKDDYEI